MPIPGKWQNDGNRTAQSYPRDEQACPSAQVPERKETGKDTDGTGYNDHEESDQQADDHDVQHFVRIDKQPQCEEHDDLEQPGESVHEGIDFLAESKS